MFGCAVREFTLPQTKSLVGLLEVAAGMLEEGVGFRNMFAELDIAELLL